MGAVSDHHHEASTGPGPPLAGLDTSFGCRAKNGPARRALAKAWRSKFRQRPGGGRSPWPLGDADARLRTADRHRRGLHLRRDWRTDSSQIAIVEQVIRSSGRCLQCLPALDLRLPDRAAGPEDFRDAPDGMEPGASMAASALVFPAGIAQVDRAPGDHAQHSRATHDRLLRLANPPPRGGGAQSAVRAPP